MGKGKVLVYVASIDCDNKTIRDKFKSALIEIGYYIQGKYILAEEVKNNG